MGRMGWWVGSSWARFTPAPAFPPCSPCVPGCPLAPPQQRALPKPMSLVDLACKQQWHELLAVLERGEGDTEEHSDVRIFQQSHDASRPRCTYNALALATQAGAWEWERSGCLPSATWRLPRAPPSRTATLRGIRSECVLRRANPGAHMFAIAMRFRLLDALCPRAPFLSCLEPTVLVGPTHT
mgnify:CR=1 FL=1